MRVLTCILMASAFSPSNVLFAKPYGDHTPWAALSSQVTCTLAQQEAPTAKKPVFAVSCLYKGKDTHKVVWDNNFGLLLWEQLFILTAQQGKVDKQHSTNLKTITSSTYPPRATVDLTPNSTLTATLDLNTLPASYLTNLISGTTPTILVLSIKGDSPPPIPCGPDSPEASWYVVSKPITIHPK